MLIRTNVSVSNQHKETLPSFGLYRKCSRAQEEDDSLRGWYKLPLQTDLRPVFSFLHLWPLWISLSVLNLIVRTEPRSVLRGNFGQGRLCRQWQQVRWWWAVLLYLTLSSRCATARGGRGEERTIQCGEEARPNKMCHTSITQNEQAHTESASNWLLEGNLWDSMKWFIIFLLIAKIILKIIKIFNKQAKG